MRKMVSIRMSEAEHDEFETSAKLVGLSTAQYIKSQATKQMKLERSRRGSSEDGVMSSPQ